MAFNDVRIIHPGLQACSALTTCLQQCLSSGYIAATFGRAAAGDYLRVHLGCPNPKIMDGADRQEAPILVQPTHGERPFTLDYCVAEWGRALQVVPQKMFTTILRPDGARLQGPIFFVQRESKEVGIPLKWTTTSDVSNLQEKLARTAAGFELQTYISLYVRSFRSMVVNGQLKSRVSGLVTRGSSDFCQVLGKSQKDSWTSEHWQNVSASLSQSSCRCDFPPPCTPTNRSDRGERTESGSAL
jgi:hypothetical protein